MLLTCNRRQSVRKRQLSSDDEPWWFVPSVGLPSLKLRKEIESWQLKFIFIFRMINIQLHLNIELIMKLESQEEMPYCA